MPNLHAARSIHACIRGGCWRVSPNGEWPWRSSRNMPCLVSGHWVVWDECALVCPNEVQDRVISRGAVEDWGRLDRKWKTPLARPVPFRAARRETTLQRRNWADHPASPHGRWLCSRSLAGVWTWFIFLRPGFLRGRVPSAPHQHGTGTLEVPR